MATKNLTRKFIDIRSAAKASRTARGVGQQNEENLSDSELLSGSSSSSSNWKATATTEQPKWIEKIEAAEGDISRIQTKSMLMT